MGSQKAGREISAKARRSARCRVRQAARLISRKISPASRTSRRRARSSRSFSAISRGRWVSRCTAPAEKYRRSTLLPLSKQGLSHGHSFVGAADQGGRLGGEHRHGVRLGQQAEIFRIGQEAGGKEVFRPRSQHGE